MSPTPRNASCPCGSGQRYKLCCGRLAGGSRESSWPAVAGAGRDPALESILLSALSAQRSNELEEAERLYEQALKLDPKNIDALHMLGVVCLSMGKLSLAEQLISSADALCPKPVDAIRHNLALVRQTGGAGRGEATIESVIAARGESPPPSSAGGDEIIEETTRLIAFYLPQYHRIPENDLWWGDGFTEWANVRRAQPNFEGHYQPHVPSEMGYYDLSDEEVLVQQAMLARQYGISGFCFYYYWFSGKRLLEMPLDRLLRTGRPDFPYCLCWANENWSRNWDGGNRELLMEQRYLPGDPESFIRSLLPHFRDRRYIRVGNRPLLMVYRASAIPDPQATFSVWRRVCEAEGIEPPYIVIASTFGQSTAPAELGADALSDFPPHGAQVHLALRTQLRGLSPTFKGSLIGYNRTVAHYLSRNLAEHPHFPGVIPSWDNTARRQSDGTLVLGATPAAFEVWLRELIYRASHKPNAEERVVFINAWNEWAEGCHLEPDQRYGRAWLEACRIARRIPVTYQGVFGEVSPPSLPKRAGCPAAFPLAPWPPAMLRAQPPAWGNAEDACIRLADDGGAVAPLKLLWSDELPATARDEDTITLPAPSVDVRFLANAELHGMAWMSRDGRIPTDPAVYPSYFDDWVRDGRVYGQVQGDRPDLRTRHFRTGWHVLHYNAAFHGHWLLEALPKLLVIREFVRRWPAYAATPIFVPGTFPQHLIDHTRAVLRTTPVVTYDPGTEYVACQSLLVPTGGVNYGYHPWIAGAIDAIPACEEPELSDRIYVSRRTASPLRVFENAAQIEALAAEAGLRVVYPEDHPLEKQIAIFRKARVVVGEFGSGLHNAIFSLAGTQVLCLNRGNCLQSRIARLKGQSLGYLLPAEGRAITWGDGPAEQQRFGIDPDRFRARLAGLAAS